MKTTDALTIRSRDIFRGGRAVVVDGLLKILPLGRKAMVPGPRSAIELNPAVSETLASRLSGRRGALPGMAGSRSGAFWE